jgi:hypothetical protein
MLLIVIISNMQKIFSKATVFRSTLVLLILILSGTTVYSPEYIKISLGAISASFVLVISYYLAKALSSYNFAYYFSALSFWLVAIPALWHVVNADARLLSEFFIGSSENVVSSWLIISSAAMMAARYSECKRIIFVPFIVTVIISVSLYTRASIAVSFGLLLFSIYARFGIGRVILVIGFLGAPILFYLRDFFSVIIDIISHTKFSSGGLESPRWNMWSAYIRDLNALSLLIGVDVSSIPEIHRYSDNPHSSFIRFHSMFGIFPLIAGTFVLLIFCVRCKLLYIAMLFFILIRASTDTILVGVVFDVFLMIVVTSAFRDPARSIIKCNILESSTVSPLKNTITILVPPTV